MCRNVSNGLLKSFPETLEGFGKISPSLFEAAPEEGAALMAFAREGTDDRLGELDSDRDESGDEKFDCGDVSLPPAQFLPSDLSQRRASAGSDVGRSLSDATGKDGDTDDVEFSFDDLF